MNKYEVLDSVGEGAYGIVLRCRNRETGELVAVKKFKESEEDEMVKKTTLREVKVLRMLRDRRGIVGLKEAFRRKGRLYLVFEYVGKNLLEVLENYPKGLPADLVKRFTYMLLEAIHSCHSANVLHRDIKPENLLINSKEKTLKLCDFGFARPSAQNTPIPEYTDYVATRWYRSPELLLGTTNYDEKVDIWSIGCIMSEMIDAQALFPGESEAGQLFLIQKMLGNFSPSQVTTFNNNPRFEGYTLPKVVHPETLETYFRGKASRKAIQFLKCLLQLSPVKRVSSEEALRHPWFDGDYNTEMSSKINPLWKSSAYLFQHGQGDPESDRGKEKEKEKEKERAKEKEREKSKRDDSYASTKKRLVLRSNPTPPTNIVRSSGGICIAPKKKPKKQLPRLSEVKPPPLGSNPLLNLNPSNPFISIDKQPGHTLFMQSGTVRSSSVSRNTTEPFLLERTQRPSSGSAITVADMALRPFSGNTLGMLSRRHIGKPPRQQYCC